MGRVNVSVTELNQTVNITIQESSTVSSDIAAAIDDFQQAGVIDLLQGTRTVPLKKVLMNDHYTVSCYGLVEGRIGKIDIIVISQTNRDFIIDVPEDCTVKWELTKY